jgi:DNA-binding transcriptional MerR regulator
MAEPSAPTTPAERTGAHLSIGEVLALLLEEFPDVTISKIRFLESQGLIDPERTASGYRKFYSDDVELLRCILREQRENYLPLRVIKDRIDSGEIDPTGDHARPDVAHRGIKNVGAPIDASTHPSAGLAHGAAALFQRTDQVPASAAPTPAPATPALDTTPPAPSTPPSTPPPPSTSPSTSGSGSTQLSMSGVGMTPEPAPPPAEPIAPVTAPVAAAETTTPAPETTAPAPVGAVLPGLLLSADELCAMSGLTQSQLSELQTYGVVAAHSGRDGGPFDEDAVEIATICKRFLDAGIEPRHLRGWRVAADREAGLLEQLIQPLLRQRNPEARASAVAQLNELEATGSRLRHAMMRSALREHGLH